MSTFYYFYKKEKVLRMLETLCEKLNRAGKKVSSRLARLSEEGFNQTGIRVYVCYIQHNAYPQNKYKLERYLQISCSLQKSIKNSKLYYIMLKSDLKMQYKVQKQPSNYAINLTCTKTR